MGLALLIFITGYALYFGWNECRELPELENEEL